ncbi:hypothetical protein ACM01_15085 [Streptomyces viridochromogenes]|uniref:ParB/Sulfiredoxin domain-containing protein n=1 Tax=Streptomyces viridochromogenes TaxID=1938 RepID=A0A0J7ZGD4_STRVR|nr:hypothetical protein [Streptomyces viridochromogenes]KMS74238.1 hypothetical protein ACM01_15085 [Streptomyces viridochromogenes]
MAAGASGPTMTFGSRKKKRSIWDDPDATEIIEIPLEQLHPNPFNPRIIFRDEDIEDLRESINAEDGLLQDLSVAEVEPFLEYWRERLAEKQPDLLPVLEEALGSVPPEDFVTLIGHNRKLALLRDGRATAPCKITNSKIPRARLLGLPENMRRVPLNPIEQALAFQGALNDGLTQVEIAAQTGTRQPHISRRLKLLQLPQEVQTALMDGLVVSEAEVLLDRLEDPEHRLQAWKIMESEGIKAAFAAARVLNASASKGKPSSPLPPQKTQSPGEAETNVDASEETTPPTNTTGDDEKPTAKDEAGRGNDDDGPADSAQDEDGKDESTPDPAEEAAAKRDHACRALIAAGVPSNPRETIRILGPALVVGPNKNARERAYEWLRSMAKPVGPNAPRVTAYFDAVAASGDVKLMTQVAFALALATAELRAADTARTWDKSDIDYLNHLKSVIQYEPTEWEQRRLTGE